MPLLFLEEYLDTVVALPNDVQRSLSLINEQEAFHQEKSQIISENISKLLSDHKSLSSEEASELLDQIRATLIENLEHAEEKVALAENIYSTVSGHINKLEDDFKHFEEEVRLSKMAAANRTVSHLLPQPVAFPVGSEEAGKKREKRSKSKEELIDADLTVSQAASGRKRSRGLNSAQAEDGVSELREKSKLLASRSGDKPEQTYCICGQPSYGEMIGCDANSDCEIEWFHYGCVGLTTPPKDQWFCDDCRARRERERLGEVLAKSKNADRPKPNFV